MSRGARRRSARTMIIAGLVMMLAGLGGFGLLRLSFASATPRVQSPLPSSQIRASAHALFPRFRILALYVWQPAAPGIKAPPVSPPTQALVVLGHGVHALFWAQEAGSSGSASMNLMSLGWRITAPPSTAVISAGGIDSLSAAKRTVVRAWLRRVGVIRAKVTVWPFATSTLVAAGHPGKMVVGLISPTAGGVVTISGPPPSP